MDYAARRAKLVQSVQNADAIALVPGANLKYFTGLNFHTSERPIIALVQGERLALIIPALEVPQVHARADLEAQLFVWTDAEGYQGAFEAAVKALGLTDATIAIDDKSMRLFEWMGFEAVGSTIRRHPVGTDLLLIRQQKDADELAALREACKRSEAAFDALLAWIKPGMTEREIGFKLDTLLIEHGCHGLSFESLVQTGPNTALPHGAVTDRALQPGEFLLVDWGGRYEGYPADLTRTVVYGTPSAEMQRIHATVVAANRAGVAACKPGARCADVDKAARDVIEAAGYGEYFIHRTGHGLGLEVHELPQIASGVDAPLTVGSVFTVEPGIYVPGLGGVRIEDNVVITETGVEELTVFRRQIAP